MNSRLIYTTMTPVPGACNFGGTSFMMIVDPTTGARIESAVLDTNGDKQLDATDKLTVGLANVYASGVQSTVGISPTPTIVTAGSIPGAGVPQGSGIYGTAGSLKEGSTLLKAYAIVNPSNAGMQVPMIGLSSSSGRVSWREVLRN